MGRFARILAALLASVLVLGTSGCLNAGLIAKVNGDGIKTETFDAEVERYRAQYPTMFQNSDGEFRFRRTLLEQLIDAQLLRQAAKKEGVEVSDADVDAQIENLKKGFADEAAFETALEKSGYDSDGFREFTRDQLTSQKLIDKVAEDIAVPDADVKKQYDENKDKYTRQPYEMIHVAHVLVNDEKTAKQVAADIAGGTDFAGAAKKYSKDAATASKGGDLGWASMPYAKEFQTAAEKLAVGDVSAPVKTSFGWHVIKLIERKDSKQKTFDEVKEQIRQILFQQRQAGVYQEYLAKLRAEAKIEIFDKDLEEAMQGSATATSTK